MHRFWATLVLLVLVAYAAPVGAQDSPWIPDTSGGPAPAATFCPNTGGCFTSLPAAIKSLREETPDVGQFLYQSSLGFYNDIPRLYYAVKNQPIESELPRTYAVNDGSTQVAYCPNSIQGNRCEDEAELIAGYTKKMDSSGRHPRKGLAHCYCVEYQGGRGLCFPVRKNSGWSCT